MKIPFNKETATFFKHLNIPIDVYWDWSGTIHEATSVSIDDLIDEEGILGKTNIGNHVYLAYDGATWIESGLFNNKSLFELVLK